ncbi:uncharacterized protein ACN427_014945 [Glossina fuscipes fuscipes]
MLILYITSLSSVQMIQKKRTYKMKGIVILCIISYLVPNAWSECILEIPGNKEYAPSWEKKIGDEWFKIPFITNRLKVQDGETINGYCASGFADIEFSVEVERDCGYYDHECKRNPMQTEWKQIEVADRNIAIECSGDSLKCGSSVLTDVSTIECNKVTWAVKSAQSNETKTSWCKNELHTFKLSTNNLHRDRILAHICYDLREFSLQAVKYNTTKRNAKAWSANEMLPVALNDLPEATILSSEVKFLNTTVLHIENDVLQRHLETLSKRNPWLKLTRYEYANIIQSGPFLNYFNQYHQLLDILWWNNLRVANWRHFMNALEQHTTIYSYIIYTGTLDVVQIPVWSNPSEFEYLEVQNGYVNSTMPQYIWMYLESSDGKNPDLYVFGYNSPYAEFFPINKVKFCTDICGDFDWLKNARFSFHYNNFGIVFCCSPESVKISAYGTILPHKLSTPPLEIAHIPDNISPEEEQEEELSKLEEIEGSTENPEVAENSEKQKKPYTIETHIYADSVENRSVN